MDQKKIGSFLKELRKEKGITQEKFAEYLNVSGRTVSRWETGSNLPDISLLVDIADFYDVDVREIIEGERKSEMMDEELKDVANKMADYAGEEKTKLMKWVQIIGFIGVIVMTISIILQCANYKPGIGSFFAVIASFVGLVISIIDTLYATGVLEKILKKKDLVLFIKIASGVLVFLSLSAILKTALFLSIGYYDYAKPFDETMGIESYNKEQIVKEYSGDFDTGFFILPDSTDKMVKPEYKAAFKTGMFDSDGYIFLKADYNETDFNEEIDRLSHISCTIESPDESSYKEVRYDETTYNYPAYITVDGYDYVYEYALVDDENKTIIYVILSYPEYDKLKAFKDYLKKDPKAYDLNNENVLENFTIYAFKMSNLDGYFEYTDTTQE